VDELGVGKVGKITKKKDIALKVVPD